MLCKRVPIVIPGQAQATSTSDFTRKTNIQNYGRLIRIKAIAVCNNDNSSTRVNLGYVRGSTPYYFDTLVLTNDTYFYMSNPDILIPSDYQIIIKFISPNDGDTYYYNIICEEEVYTE